MGWASGFQAGTSMAKQWLDTYNEAERRRQFEGIQKAKEFEQYTPQQGEQLRGLSEQVDEQGRPRYQFEIDPGSTQYRVREIMYPQERPEIEGYSPTWLGRDMGPAPQQGAEVYTSPVPMDGLDVRTVLDSNAPGYTRDATPINRGLGFYPAMGAEAADTAPRSYTDLTTNAPEYSPDLRISRPDDSAAYRGLTREMGEAQNFAPGQVNYLGKTYAPGGLTPEVRRAAQLEAYADVIARDNPLEAERLRSMVAQEKRAAAAETRAAELHPLQLGAAKQNLETGALQLEDLKISAADKKRVREWDAFRAANPGAPLKTMLAKADELGIGAETQNKMIMALTGIKTSEMAHTKTLITSMIKDMTLPEMLAAHKDNDMISPGRHYETVQDANGNLSLFLVDTATGKKVSEAPEFVGNPQQTEAYLRAAATDRATLLEVTQSIKKFEADLREKESVAARNQAYARTGGAGGGAGATREYVAMVGEARMLSTEIERLTGIVNDKTADPKLRKSAEARLNDALSQYEEVSGAIRGMRGLGGTPAPTDRGRLYKAGIPFPGPDGETLYVLDKDTYEFDIAPGMAKEYKAPPAGGGAVDVGAKSGTGVATTGGAKTTPPAQSVKKSTADEIADIESRLATDDRIKAGGLGGIGGRAIREGAFPMGIGERRDLERRLEELKRKR